MKPRMTFSTTSCQTDAWMAVGVCNSWHISARLLAIMHVHMLPV
jgi:hypothetical protein